MNQDLRSVVLRLIIFTMMFVLIFGTSYAYASTFEFTLDESPGQIEIKGYATLESQVSLILWNDEQEIIINNESRLTDNDNGAFGYVFSADDLSGYGNYVGELTHNGLTQKFEFSLNDTVESPLKQMNHGATMDDVICKTNLVKLYKLSPSGHHSNVICVKSTSVDKLVERGYSVATHTSSPLSKSLDEFTISDQLKKTIREKVDDGVHQSLFVGIITNEGTEKYYYGNTAKDGTPIDENTIFETGSISKVFTSLILADMVVNGEVNLDDSIDKFLPENVQTPSFDGHSITLLDLATHTSGLPVMPNYPPNPDLDKEYEFNKAGLYEYLSDFEIQREIGSQYEYSNTGGSLLGHILSLQSGKSYEMTLKERVLDKLGMDSTCVHQCDEIRDQFAKPHALGELVDEVGLDDDMAGAGGVKSSGKDMLLFLSYAMDFEDSELHEAFELTQDANHQINEILYIGLGWHIIDDGERNIVSHNGATNGFASFVGFDSDSNEGVVVLTNSQVLVDEIGFDILDYDVEELINSFKN